MEKDPKQLERVQMSLMGCRMFYFSVYGLFYLACLLYPNELKSNLIYTLFYYLPITSIAITLFIKAGNNPGFVDETKEPVPDDPELGFGMEMRSIGHPYDAVT